MQCKSDLPAPAPLLSLLPAPRLLQRHDHGRRDQPGHQERGEQCRDDNDRLLLRTLASPLALVRRHGRVAARIPPGHLEVRIHEDGCSGETVPEAVVLYA